jgi:membrane associated rhomboid family serine protease
LIFPWLTGVKYLKQVMLVWVLLGLNIFIFLMTTAPESSTKSKKNLIIEQVLGSADFSKVQAFYYKNYLKESNLTINKIEKSEDLLNVQKDFEKGNIDIHQYENILVQISFKDDQFIETILEMPSKLEPYGDQVLDKKWRKSFKDFLENHKSEAQSLYGLSSFGHQWSHFFTYQFVHSGISHLVSNMLVLFTFGIAIEVYYGAFMLGFLYLMGGMMGAIFFMFVGGLSIAPLIGASASVSALIGFYLIAEQRKHVAFFYFLTPIQGYFGEIYLSKWWLIPMALVNDITGVLSTPGWMASIAHTAHLGATLFGLLSGFVYLSVASLYFLKKVPKKIKN